MRPTFPFNLNTISALSSLKSEWKVQLLFLKPILSPENVHVCFIFIDKYSIDFRYEAAEKQLNDKIKNVCIKNAHNKKVCIDIGASMKKYQACPVTPVN